MIRHSEKDCRNESQHRAIVQDSLYKRRLRRDIYCLVNVALKRCNQNFSQIRAGFEIALTIPEKHEFVREKVKMVPDLDKEGDCKDEHSANANSSPIAPTEPIRIRKPPRRN